MLAPLQEQGVLILNEEVYRMQQNEQENSTILQRRASLKKHFYVDSSVLILCKTFATQEPLKLSPHKLLNDHLAQQKRRRSDGGATCNVSNAGGTILSANERKKTE
jgi:hypothetical protein